jgi:hypothetical protein
VHVQRYGRSGRLGMVAATESTPCDRAIRKNGDQLELKAIVQSGGVRRSGFVVTQILTHGMKR